MAKYLVVMVLLVAGGVALLAFACDRLDEPRYEVELVEADMATQTIHLTEPQTHAGVKLVWQGSVDADGIVVEKKEGDDFLVLDTLDVASGEWSFTDPDTLECGEPVVYRLLALDEARAWYVGTYTLLALDGIEFLVPDTVYPENGRLSLSWRHLPEVEEAYRVKLMTLETLAPLPGGELLAKARVEPTGTGEVRWTLDTEELTPQANYILCVEAEVHEEPLIRTVTGYRLFVLGKEVQGEEAE